MVQIHPWASVDTNCVLATVFLEIDMSYKKGEKGQHRDATHPKPIDHDKFFKAIHLWELGKMRGGIGSIEEAAKMVGLSRTTMTKWMEMYYNGEELPRGLFKNVPIDSPFYSVRYTESDYNITNFLPGDRTVNG